MHSTTSSKVEPVKSWVESGGMHYVQGAVDLTPMVEDSEDENDMVSIICYKNKFYICYENTFIDKLFMLIV